MPTATRLTNETIKRRFHIDINEVIRHDLVFSEMLYLTYLVDSTEDILYLRKIESEREGELHLLGTRIEDRLVEQKITQTTYQTLLKGRDLTTLEIGCRLFLCDNTYVRLYGYLNDELINKRGQRLNLAEATFSNVKESNQFKKPYWFAEEVTDNPEFTDFALWRKVQ